MGRRARKLNREQEQARDHEHERAERDIRATEPTHDTQQFHAGRTRQLALPTRIMRRRVVYVNSGIPKCISDGLQPFRPDPKDTARQQRYTSGPQRRAAACLFLSHFRKLGTPTWSTMIRMPRSIRPVRTVAGVAIRC